MAAGYKPSPLGYGSPRSSPFRRPESPSSPSTLRYSTPPASTSPTKFGNAASKLEGSPVQASTTSSRQRGVQASSSEDVAAQLLGSPAPVACRQQTSQTMAQGNALSKLQPAQVRVLRDGFQILDRDSDGVVNREDIADMLNQLGLPASQAELTQFFPPSGPQTMTLAVFLNSLAATLAAMSPSPELLSAFSAFDDDDSGQVDLAELCDALSTTVPEPGERAPTAAEVAKIVSGFSGRRAFSKNTAGGLGKRGEVFKYQDFVNSILGGGNGSEPSSRDGSEN